MLTWQAFSTKAAVDSVFFWFLSIKITRSKADVKSNLASTQGCVFLCVPLFILECLLVLVLLRSVLQLVKNAIMSAQSPRSQHVQYFVMLQTNLTSHKFQNDEKSNSVDL